jgi:gluconolactonase
LATGLLFPEGPVAMKDGSVIFVEIERETVSRLTPDGKVEVVKKLGGGPNGLAVGPKGEFYVCNNGGFLFTKVAGLNRTRAGTPEGYKGGWIETLDIKTGATRRLYDSCDGHRLNGPNDIVFDKHGGFYFTDLGKSRDRDRDHGAVYYGLADGSKVVEVGFPMVTANGCGLSPDGTILYVAETEPGRLWAFDLIEPGRPKKHPFPSPHGGRLVCGLPGYQRFDSLAVDAYGNICIATIVTGCITVVSPNGQILRQIPTGDPITTNICFGGPDMKTAYITLSGIGHLVAMDWPEPGLRLNYE